MLEKLKLIEDKYLKLEEASSRPDFYNDTKAAAALLKEQKELLPFVEAYREYAARTAELADLKEMLGSRLEPEMKEMVQDELEGVKQAIIELEERIKILLLPSDPNDSRNVIVEIRGGAGGEEAALFSNSLYRMYTMYAETKRWKSEIMSINETELGGIKEVCFLINGDGAWSRFKFESGVHRVQRVPDTESSGRIHTSTVTVAVLPEMEELDFEINPTDLQIDTFRSSGAGGQHVNKTESAIRITHLPTGIVVECQDERSQHKNKDRAMKILNSKLYEIEQAKQTAAQAAERKSQVGTGDRSERIRTYNFPQGRVTDHRIGLTLYKIEAIMNGDIDELIDALVTADRAEKLRMSEDDDN